LLVRGVCFLGYCLYVFVWFWGRMHTHRKGVKARSQVSRMTFKALIARLTQTEESPVAHIRTILSKVAGFPEHQIYKIRPESHWATIVKDALGVTVEEITTVGVTGYATDTSFLETLKGALESEYTVHAMTVDDQGWRQLLVCGKGDDDPNPMVICGNWYNESREAVKARFRKKEDTENNTNTESNDSTEEIDLDPFE